MEGEPFSIPSVLATAQPTTTLTVVIVTHRRPQSLARTLESLASAARPEAARRTLIVENGAPSGAEAVAGSAAAHLNTDYVFVKSAKKCDALNTAIEQCGDDLLVFLDDDVRVSPDLLTAYGEAARECGPGRYFGGPTGVDYDVAPPEWVKRYLPPSALGHLRDFHARDVRYPPAFLGFNWAAYASELRGCGGFSARFGPGTETGMGDESFMQLRLNQRGIYGRFVPEAVVWHHVPAERCTPEWALARARGGGLQMGIFAEWKARSNGVPLRPWLRLARWFFGSSRLSDPIRLALQQPQGIFWARYTNRRLRGFWDGMRQGALERPLDEDVWIANGLKLGGRRSRTCRPQPPIIARTQVSQKQCPKLD